MAAGRSRERSAEGSHPPVLILAAFAVAVAAPVLADLSAGAAAADAWWRWLHSPIRWGGAGLAWTLAVLWSFRRQTLRDAVGALTGGGAFLRTFPLIALAVAILVVPAVSVASWVAAPGATLPSTFMEERTVGACGWDSATFFEVGSRRYVRDPEGVVAAHAAYEPFAVLPREAVARAWEPLRVVFEAPGRSDVIWLFSSGRPGIERLPRVEATCARD